MKKKLKKKATKQYKTLAPIHTSIKLESEYTKRLNVIVKSLHVDVIAYTASLAANKALKSSYKLSAFSAFAVKKIAEIAPKINVFCGDFINSINVDCTKKLNNAFAELELGITLNPIIYKEQVADILETSVIKNANLIKTIPQQYLNQVSQDFSDVITGNMSSGALEKKIEERYGLSKKRAKMIVSDQTAKIYADITRTRALELGLNKFQWLHTSGSIKPRPIHLELNNQVFEWDKPPITNDKNERHLPASEINCKCIAKIVIDF